MIGRIPTSSRRSITFICFAVNSNIRLGFSDRGPNPWPGRTANNPLLGAPSLTNRRVVKDKLKPRWNPPPQSPPLPVAPESLLKS